MKALAVALLTSAAVFSVGSAKATDTGSRYNIPEAQPVRLICTEDGRCFRIIRGREFRGHDEMGPRFREGERDRFHEGEMGRFHESEMGRFHEGRMLREEHRATEPTHAGEPHTGVTTGQGSIHMAPPQ